MLQFLSILVITAKSSPLSPSARATWAHYFVASADYVAEVVNSFSDYLCEHRVVASLNLSHIGWHGNHPHPNPLPEGEGTQATPTSPGTISLPLEVSWDRLGELVFSGGYDELKELGYAAGGVGFVGVVPREVAACLGVPYKLSAGLIRHHHRAEQFQAGVHGRFGRRLACPDALDDGFDSGPVGLAYHVPRRSWRAS